MDNYFLYLKDQSQFIIFSLIGTIIAPVIIIFLIVNTEIIQESTNSIHIILLSSLGGVMSILFPFSIGFLIREIIFYLGYKKKKLITEIVIMDGIPLRKKGMSDSKQIVYKIAAKKKNGKRDYFLIYNPKLLGYKKGTLERPLKDFIDKKYQITYYKYSNIVEKFVEVL